MTKSDKLRAGFLTHIWYCKSLNQRLNNRFLIFMFIVISEVLINLIFVHFILSSNINESVTEAVSLLSLTSPLIYFFVFRPLLTNLSKPENEKNEKKERDICNQKNRMQDINRVFITAEKKSKQGIVYLNKAKNHIRASIILKLKKLSYQLAPAVFKKAASENWFEMLSNHKAFKRICCINILQSLSFIIFFVYSFYSILENADTYIILTENQYPKCLIPINLTFHLN